MPGATSLSASLGSGVVLSPIPPSLQEMRKGCHICSTAFQRFQAFCVHWSTCEGDAPCRLLSDYMQSLTSTLDAS